MLNLDHTLAEAHAELAYVKFRYDWDYAGAEAEYKEAIALNPNDATAHFLYGEYLVTMQRFDEATREQQRAQERDPLSLPNKMMIAARLCLL